MAGKPFPEIVPTLDNTIAVHVPTLLRELYASGEQTAGVAWNALISSQVSSSRGPAGGSTTETDVSYILASLVSSSSSPSSRQPNNAHSQNMRPISRHRRCMVPNCPDPAGCFGRGNRKSCPAHPQFDPAKRHRRSHRFG